MQNPISLKLALLMYGALIFTFMTTSVVAKERVTEELNKQLSPSKKILYKTVGDKKLYLHIFEPKDLKKGVQRPAFVAIHGGGWTGHTARDCFAMLDRMTKRGMVGISVDYRLARKNNATVFDCVRDARSAVRYVREHAKELGIDPDRIAVAGFSAGGHLAAATALFEFDEPGEDKTISCRPDALVLYYPVIDTSKEGYGQAKIGKRWKEISPAHQVKPNMPPTIIFHGTGDTTTPYAGAVAFQKAMETHKNDSELISHPDGVHGYFIFDLKLFDEVTKRTEQFLSEKKILDESKE